MDLDEWIKDEVARLERFRAMWERESVSDPDFWPAIMEAGEWDEQYRCFDDPGPSSCPSPLVIEGEMK